MITVDQFIKWLEVEVESACNAVTEHEQILRGKGLSQHDIDVCASNDAAVMDSGAVARVVKQLTKAIGGKGAKDAAEDLVNEMCSLQDRCTALSEVQHRVGPDTTEEELARILQELKDEHTIDAERDMELSKRSLRPS